MSVTLRAKSTSNCASARRASSRDYCKPLSPYPGSGSPSLWGTSLRSEGLKKTLAEAPPRQLLQALQERGVTPLVTDRIIVATLHPYETTAEDKGDWARTSHCPYYGRASPAGASQHSRGDGLSSPSFGGRFISTCWAHSRQNEPMELRSRWRACLDAATRKSSSNIVIPSRLPRPATFSQGVKRRYPVSE